MSNENNEGIIIEGGITCVLVSAMSNSFPIELPVEFVNELTIVDVVQNLVNNIYQL